MPTISPFTPQPGKTVNIVPTVASANVLVSSGAGQQVRILNTASATIFIAWGASTITASSGSDMPVFPAVGGGDYEMVTIPVGSVVTYFAAAMPSATSALSATSIIYFTPGEGF